MYFNLLNEIQPLPLSISASIIIFAVILFAFIFDSAKNKIDTHTIAFSGICIALSIGLSFVKIFKLPQGGSITLFSTLPFLLFAYIYGTKKGVLAGIILGLLNFAFEPFVVHPAQVILDYIVSYGAMGLSGMFSKFTFFKTRLKLSFVFGSVVAVLIRFACQVLSGIFAFSSYTSSSVVYYSLAYNSYLFIDVGIAIIGGFLALSQKQVFKLVRELKEKESK